jgi:hypothetical protein
VDRRGAAVSVLGIAAPICLLAVAWSADRAFHHKPCPAAPALPPVPRVDPPDPEWARKEALDNLLHSYGQVCKRPDNVEQCTPFAFDYMLADKFRALGVSRSELERRWLAEISTGDPVAPFGLAWLGTTRALPALRNALVASRAQTLWHPTTPDDPEILFADDEFPRQRALIAAIERISGRPLLETVKLSRGERAKLSGDAERCDGGRAATWLLHKLDGAHLPPENQDRFTRLACEGPLTPGLRRRPYEPHCDARVTPRQGP